MGYVSARSVAGEAGKSGVARLEKRPVIFLESVDYRIFSGDLIAPIAGAHQPRRGSPQATFRSGKNSGGMLIVENKSHHQVDAVLRNLALLHNYLLILHPRA